MMIDESGWKKLDMLKACLIGEHIDYNGFGVLPMALQQSVFVAVSCQQQSPLDTTTESTLELHIQQQKNTGQCIFRVQQI